MGIISYSMDVTLINRHWNEGFFYSYPFERKLFSTLVQTLQQKFILSCIGLRRTGKTTLLKQLIDHLIQQKVPRHHLFYYTFDDPAELEEVVNEFLKASSLSLGAQPLYFFLDEIQKLDNWQNKVKIFYDHYPNIKFIVSGSSSLFIRKGAESLAGRLQEFILHPLSFEEFLRYKKLDSWLTKSHMFAKDLEREAEIYSTQQFFDSIGMQEDTRKEYVDTLIRKVIFEDIPQVFPIDDPQVLLRLISIISTNPGMLMDYNSLSQELHINEKTISRYTEILERAFLIKKLYNYSTNLITSDKKLKKVYPICSSFCQSDVPHRIESLVVTQAPTSFFWRRIHEVDCVQTNPLIPIEVKYRDSIQQKDLRGIYTFMKKFAVQRGIVVSKNLNKKGDLEIIPLYQWLLQQER